jgi:hypothetical protein
VNEEGSEHIARNLPQKCTGIHALKMQALTSHPPSPCCVCARALQWLLQLC